jgi:hypothetical protein
VAAARLPGTLRRLDVDVRSDSVEVLAELTVDRIALRALPGAPTDTNVVARARAVVVK